MPLVVCNIAELPFPHGCSPTQLTLMQIMRTVQIHVAVLVVTSFFFSEAPFHAEFVALSLCIQECLYIQQLASELKQSSDQPVVIYEDNQSTIHIAQNSEHHGRSKHIDVRYMFVRDLVEAKHFELRYCNTKQQLADFFTKAHLEPAFNYFCKRLRLLSLQDFTHSG
ncbi:hypothetical protein AeMF1_020649, partial [Aphanomyces euteiches]